MGIEEVFRTQGRYAVYDIDEKSPGEVARDLIKEHFIETPASTALVWAFYKIGGDVVRDGLRLDIYSTRKGDTMVFDITRVYNPHLDVPNGKIMPRVPLDGYLADAQTIYLQLCGNGFIKGIGIEASEEGTKVGRYVF